MALVEGCRHEVEISVPVSDVEQETERVVAELQKKVRLPGFRPGKAPASLVRSKFQSEIRQDVIEHLVPKHFRKQAEQDNLQIVGQPNVSDVHFHAGEPLRFKVEFEVAPQIELGEYRGVVVEYAEPVVTDEDVEQRLNQLRDQKAEYVNQEPRPVEDGDFAVISLKSIAGVAEPVEQDELMLHVGSTDTLPAFTENLRGMTPGDEKDISISYPEDYGQEKLAGKTVEFHVVLKAVRKKELPEANDDFARDLGDFQTLDELRETIRQQTFREREHRAQHDAKQKIVEKLIDAHDFPVPEAFIDRQIEITLEQQFRQLRAQGLDPRQLNLDWNKIKESQRERALREVKGSLLIEKIADRESVEVLNEEVDREVQRIAKQQREPVAATRMKLEKDGTLRRIASAIRTDKTLAWLFEHARKEAPAA